jgi:Ulp1 family protease
MLSKTTKLTLEEVTGGLGHLKKPEIIISGFNQEITRKDLQCLNPGKWLNDSIVNFYIGMINERANKRSKRGHSRIFCFNSFFYSKLMGESEQSEYNYKAVSRWSKKAKVTITEMNKVLIPCNVNKNHWTCAVIDFGKKVLGGANFPLPILSHVSTFSLDKTTHFISPPFFSCIIRRGLSITTVYVEKTSVVSKECVSTSSTRPEHTGTSHDVFRNLSIRSIISRLVSKWKGEGY